MVLLVLLGKCYYTPHGQTYRSVLLSLESVPRARPHLLWGGLLFSAYGWLFHVSGWLFCCQCFVHKKYFYFPCLAMSLAVWVLGNDGFPFWVQKETLCRYLLKELWKVGVISSLNYWKNSPVGKGAFCFTGPISVSAYLIDKGPIFFFSFTNLSKLCSSRNWLISLRSSNL